MCVWGVSPRLASSLTLPRQPLLVVSVGTFWKLFWTETICAGYSQIYRKGPERSVQISHNIWCALFNLHGILSSLYPL